MNHRLDLASARALTLLDTEGAVHRDTRWPWENVLVEGPRVGRAHLERYAHGKLTVWHVAVMPPPGSSRPIFGADVVATEQMASLMAWDWSPTTASSPVPAALPPRCGSWRPLPVWAEPIMSRHAVSIRPDTVSDLDTFIDFAIVSLRDYLATPLGEGDPLPAIRRYALAQRRNKSLIGALRRHLGAVEADRFVREVLWPVPETLWPAAAEAAE